MKELSGGEYRNFIVTPERAVKFTKITVFLTCIWYPLPNSRRIYFVLYDIFLCFSIFLAMTLIFSLMVAIKKFTDDTVIVVKSITLIFGISNFLIKVITVTIYREKIEKFSQQLENFIASANDLERNYLQKYVNKSWKFHTYMTCSYYLAAVSVLIGPLILPQKFPCEAVYPFSVDHPAVACIVYIHQCFVGFQCSAGMALDCQAALFLWYLGARCEILVSESQHVTNPNELCVFIKKHQNLLMDAKEILQPIKVIALTTVIAIQLGMIFSAIMLISDQALMIKVQFAIVSISTAVNTFVCVWAADNLIDASSRLLSEKIYETCLYHSPSMKRVWSFIILRTHKPILIKAAGFFHELSCEFYSSLLSSALSYFTALRVLVNS